MMESRKTTNLTDQLGQAKAMKIIIIGAGGHVGSTICSALSNRHTIIKVGRNSGDIHTDITDRSSIEAMYREVGKVDAVVIAAGAIHFSPLIEFTENTFLFNLTHKAMGQINVVLAGLDYVNDGGSFTLTSGILDRDPIRMGTGAATANGAIGGFVVGAAVEMPRGMRINVVSTGVQDISLERYGRIFNGHVPVSSNRVGHAYVKSIEGAVNGKIITVD
jgi:NAD(P)-dependent dehydrogenase (short-subunit alcohol dehydrogenase family)